MTIEGEKQPDLPMADPAPPLEVEAAEGSGTGGGASPDEQELQEAAQTELQQLKEAARFATPERAAVVLEALFFAADKPLDLPTLQETTQFSKELLEAGLSAVQQRYAAGSGGIALVDLGGRWQLRTDPQVGAYVRRMLQVKPLRLTRAALETLAIIAYRQPVTRADIEAIRGVVVASDILRRMEERNWIEVVGHREAPGRPALYATTKTFLDDLGLRSLSELPPLADLEHATQIELTDARQPYTPTLDAAFDNPGPAVAGTDPYRPGVPRRAGRRRCRGSSMPATCRR